MIEVAISIETINFILRHLSTAVTYIHNTYNFVVNKVAKPSETEIYDTRAMYLLCPSI